MSRAYLCLFLTLASPLARAGDPPSPSAASEVRGELLDPSTHGPGVVETMEVVLAREAARVAEHGLSAVPAPQHSAAVAPAPSSGGSSALGGAGTAPALGINFDGPWINDIGAGWIPPDPHGAIGPNHFVAIVNQNLSVYDRTNGTLLVGTSLQSFFGVGGSIGDPRAAYDHFSGRFVITASNFVSQIRLAVTSTGDPTGSWFKTSYTASQGVDAGHWPDYPTLGFDQNGIYNAAFMVGGADTMTIFAIDKAPLVAPVQSLGTVTAFRGLPYEDSIQACVTFGTASEHFISRASWTSFRVRRLVPPLTAPTLIEVGFVTVPSHSAPPDAPVQGAIPLWTIDARPMGAVFQAGSLWTTHHISVGGRSAVRWYRINPGSLTTQQIGTIDDPVRHYFFPSIAVNASGDLALGFAGSHSGQFAGAYYSGRKASDPAGQTSTPTLLKPGAAAYQLTDNSGHNRWGDYTNTTLDPADPQSFWTIQEYARGTNEWGTWIGRLTFTGGGNVPTPFCAGDGIDPGVTQPCPCSNFGAPGRGCAHSTNASGGLLSSTGTTNPDTIVLTASGLPSIALTIFFKGNSTVAGGTIAGDGVRCIGGSLVRFGTQSAVGGTSVYPMGAQPNLSTLFGVTPGSNVHLYIQAFFRDPAAAFCPPETFNVTNALDVLY